ncbi:MAG: hypothetical protein ACRC67_18265 [Inquilinus sp.]|uniref:hypothetical protein n=1 Tax=Inquilinus sp. TaxID=1932117 RepID=UPI003F3626E9
MDMHVAIEVLALGKVQVEDAPAIHYPPGRYVVAPAVAEALRDQGVLAPELPAAEPQSGDAPGARKGKGA